MTDGLVFIQMYWDNVSVRDSKTTMSTRSLRSLTSALRWRRYGILMATYDESLNRSGVWDGCFRRLNDCDSQEMQFVSLESPSNVGAS